MSEEEYAPEGNKTYDLMLSLERLESLREDLEEANFKTLAEIEAALALTVPGTNPATQEKHAMLTQLRTDLLELGLTDLAGVEAEIEKLNDQLDTLDDGAV